MEELIHTYWREVGALVAFVGYTIRQEMLTKSNAARIKDLEERLGPDQVNEWIAFKATTTFQLAQHTEQISELKRK